MKLLVCLCMCVHTSCMCACAAHVCPCIPVSMSTYTHCSHTCFKAGGKDIEYPLASENNTMTENGESRTP